MDRSQHRTNRHAKRMQWCAYWSSALLGLAATSLAHADPRADILSVEERWDDAIVAKDRRALATILADDFVEITPHGALRTKSQIIGSLDEASPTIHPFKTEEVMVRIYGPIAVVTGRFTITATLGDREETASIRYTDVYRFDVGHWRAISAHGSIIR